MKTKRKKITIVAAVLLVAIGIAMFITFFPYRGTASPVYWTAELPFTRAGYDNITKLTKAAGEDFVIMEFTDTQLDYNQKGMKGVRTLITKSIQNQKPDLIVLTGDTVQGPLGHYLLKGFVKFLDQFKIPYMPVMGNHERDSVSDMDYMAEIWENGEYSLFQKGPWTIHGYGNYFVTVVEPMENGEEKLVYLLSGIDTGGGYEWHEDENGNTVQTNPGGATLIDYKHNYDIIYPDQIAYYEWQVNSLSAYVGKTVPSMIFTHIPVPEFEPAWEQWAGKNTDYDPLEGNPGYVENNTIPKEDGYGSRYEDVCSGALNSGLFAAAKRTGSTTHIFAGHEHNNNYSILYEGIRLTYNQKTGACSYSMKEKQGYVAITIGSEIDEASGFHQVDVSTYHYNGSAFSKVV